MQLDWAREVEVNERAAEKWQAGADDTRRSAATRLVSQKTAEAHRRLAERARAKCTGRCAACGCLYKAHGPSGCPVAPLTVEG